MTPAAFRALPKWEQVEMIAHDVSIAQMQAHERPKPQPMKKPAKTRR